MRILFLGEVKDKVLRALSSKRIRLGTANLPSLIIGIVIVMVVAFIGLLLGGVFSGVVTDVFNSTGLTGTQWETLKGQVESYSITGLRLAFIGIIVSAVAAVLGIVMYLKGRE